MATNEQQESVLYNDGEGVVFGDFNDMQRLAERRMLDYLTESFMLHGRLSTSAPKLRPISNAISIQANGTPDLTVKVQPGAILWRPAADPGQPDPFTVMHNLDAVESFTVPTADGSNPRWDIISAKVEYDPLDTGSVDAVTRDFKDAITGALTSPVTDKRRRTLLTMTYTTGTPAGSPTEPSPPAGEEVFCRVEVATSATQIFSDNIVDKRFPAGMTRIFIPNTQWLPQAGWAQSNFSVWDLLAGGPGDLLEVDIFAPLRSGPAATGSAGTQEQNRRNLRLGSVRFTYNADATFLLKLRRRDPNFPAASHADVVDLTSALTLDTVTRTALIPLDLDEPIWLNGLKSPSDITTYSGGGSLYAQVTGDDTTDRVFGLTVEFFGF